MNIINNYFRKENIDQELDASEEISTLKTKKRAILCGFINTETPKQIENMKKNPAAFI